MITRRQVLESGLAACVAAAAAAAFPAGAAPVVPDLFVFDGRHPDAAAAAAAAARLGAQIAEAGDDLTELWRSRLRPLWGWGPSVLAGVTAPGALFVIETLAADHRQRMLSRVPLTLGRDGVGAEPLVSWVIGPRAAPSTQRRASKGA
jgi:hypothetical protein